MKKILLVAVILIFSFSAAAVTDFGTGEAKPVIQNITVYRANSGQLTGGELVASGLNKTFNIDHNGTETYRFQFRIENKGTENWTIDQEDEMAHLGLDSNWNVSDIQYNISEVYNGGTFSSGKVSWSLNGGELDVSGPNSTMYAKYLVNISGSSSNYDLEFQVNDTSNSTGSLDRHNLKYTETGILDLTLDYPSNDSIVQKNKLFDLNATAECINGDCGNVTFTPLYNASESFEKINNSGTPFYVNDSSLKYCELSQSQQCIVEWRVNSTGEEGTYHSLKINSSSNYTSNEYETNKSVVEIQKLLYFNLSWNTVDFGSFEPGAVDKPAEGNSNMSYNVTLLEQSNEANFWIKLSSLVSQQNKDYTIGPANMSFNHYDDVSSSKTLSSNYQSINRSVKPGTVINTFYWLDVPFGITDGTYTGNLTIKANLTE